MSYKKIDFTNVFPGLLLQTIYLTRSHKQITTGDLKRKRIVHHRKEIFNVEHTTFNMSTVFNASRLFLLSLSITLHYVSNAAGLRATALHEKEDIVNQEHHALHHDLDAISNQEIDMLRLTDDDDLEFFKSEIEHGYLSRNDFDKAMLASQFADDDGVEMEADDQYRDRATGGFIHNHTSEVEDL